MTKHTRAQAIVMHAAPPRYKLGIIRIWIEDHRGVEIMGIRWLMEDHKPGKAFGGRRRSLT